VEGESEYLFSEVRSNRVKTNDDNTFTQIKISTSSNSRVILVDFVFRLLVKIVRNECLPFSFFQNEPGELDKEKRKREEIDQVTAVNDATTQ